MAARKVTPAPFARPWISRFEWQRITLADHPNLTRWYLAIADRAAVQRGYDVPVKINPIPIPQAGPATSRT